MPRIYRVVASPDIIPDDRNFGAKLERRNGERVLLVPYILLPLLVDRVVEKSDLFYALIRTDPRAVEKVLKWEHRQIVKSLKGLRILLGIQE